MKQLIIGDLHEKEKLGYSNFVSDGRLNEKKDVLDFIVNLSKGCDRVIFLGDQLNGRNNPSEVIKNFINFIERFEMEVIMIAGNHCKLGDGRSALDFMREISGKNWRIITKDVVDIDGDIFCPYFYKGELDCNTYEEGTLKLLDKLKSLKTGGTLFAHHAISGYNIKNIKTDNLNEIVLPKKEMEKMYNKVFCGHIHIPSNKIEEKIIYSGSVFTQEVNEGEKFVYISDNGNVTAHKLPVREIIKLENPTIKELKKIDKKSIVKVVMSVKPSDEELEKVKEVMASFDGSIIVEDFRVERKIVKFVDGELDLSTKSLLKIYADERKVDFKKLNDGLELINK